MPRVLAGTLMCPVLTVVSDFVGILGGWMIAVLQLRVASSRLLELGARGLCIHRTRGWVS